MCTHLCTEVSLLHGILSFFLEETKTNVRFLSSELVSFRLCTSNTYPLIQYHLTGVLLGSRTSPHGAPHFA